MANQDFNPNLLRSRPVLGLLEYIGLMSMQPFKNIKKVYKLSFLNLGNKVFNLLAKCTSSQAREVSLHLICLFFPNCSTAYPKCINLLGSKDETSHSLKQAYQNHLLLDNLTQTLKSSSCFGCPQRLSRYQPRKAF